MRLKRRTVLGVVLAAGALSMVAAASQQPADKPKVVEVEKLKDNLFVLRGQDSGGNTAVFVQAGGVTVVDTKNPGWGQPILDKIKELTNKPVTTIINTHTHGDHVSGNVEFPATVDVVTHENTRANMDRMGPVTGITRTDPPPQHLQGAQRAGSAEANVQRSTDAREGSRSNRSPLLRARPHERRRVRRVPGAARHACRRHVSWKEHAHHGREQWWQRRRLRGHAGKGTRREERRHDHHGPQHADDPERPARVSPSSSASSSTPCERARRPGGRSIRSRRAGRSRRSMRATRRPRPRASARTCRSCSTKSSEVAPAARASAARRRRPASAENEASSFEQHERPDIRARVVRLDHPFACRDELPRRQPGRVGLNRPATGVSRGPHAGDRRLRAWGRFLRRAAGRRPAS